MFFLSWIKNRRYLIILSIIDLFLFLLISKILFTGIIIPFFIPCILLLLFYINGSYQLSSKERSNNKKFFDIVLFKNIIFATFCILLFLVILNSFGITDNEINKLIKFIICFTASSYFTKVIFKYVFSKKIPRYLWIVYSSKDFFNQISDLSKSSSKRIELRFVDKSITLVNLLDSIRLQKSDVFGLLIEDINSLDNGLIDKLIDINVCGYPVLNKLEWCELVLERIPTNFIFPKDLVQINFPAQMGTNGVRIKRIGDLIFSILLILLSLPILIICVILIYLEDGGKIFYYQKRTGLFGKEFLICKLRTMRETAELNGPEWSSKNDSRVTKIGKLLRKYRLDEIPQLTSVIKGQMSLIGPRPERPELEEKLKKEIPNYNLKYLMKPGLSGWSQVNYPYGASVFDSKMKLSYDLFYLKHFSLTLDTIILFKTMKLVFNAEGSEPTL